MRVLLMPGNGSPTSPPAPPLPGPRRRRPAPRLIFIVLAVLVAYALPIAINAFTNTTYEDPMFESMKIIIPLAIFGGVAIGFMKGWI